MDAPPEEPALIQHASQGDSEAFATLFQRYHAMIYAFSYRLCLDRVEAQDVAQETFINAARSLQKFIAAGKMDGFRSWLYRIALNAARDSLRRRRRREVLCGELTIQQTREERARDDVSAGIAAALAALPQEWRQAVVLVFYEGMSHAQAASLLGCAEATVSWRIFRAKQQLRKKLEASAHSRTHER